MKECFWFDLCREELLLLREEAEKKMNELEGRCQELQSVIQQVSEDFQKVSCEALAALRKFKLNVIIKKNTVQSHIVLVKDVCELLSFSHRAW